MHLDVKDMVSDMMQGEKSLAKAYGNAGLESANQSLRQSLATIQSRVQDNHAKLFHEMHQRGWYKTPTAGQQAIESIIISWEQKLLKEPELSQKQ
jgi:spore coat protein CotF